MQCVNLFRRHDPSFDQWFKEANLRPYHVRNRVIACSALYPDISVFFQVTYLSPESQNEFIELIGKSVHKQSL